MRTKKAVKIVICRKFRQLLVKMALGSQENQGFREATVEMEEGMSGPDRASSKGVQSDRWKSCQISC